MLSIQIVALIVFVMSILLIPVIDQLFFYHAFNFKGDIKGIVGNEQSQYEENRAATTADLKF